MSKNIFLSTIAVCLLLVACNNDGRKYDSNIVEAVDCFAASYFNYDFMDARRYCTIESEKWLRFAANNVIDEDIELLREQKEGASHEVMDVKCVSDTVATVRLTVRNFLKRDTLGRPGHVVNKDLFVIKLVRRNEKWLVDASSIAHDSRR